MARASPRRPHAAALGATARVARSAKFVRLARTRQLTAGVGGNGLTALRRAPNRSRTAGRPRAPTGGSPCPTGCATEWPTTTRCAAISTASSPVPCRRATGTAHAHSALRTDRRASSRVELLSHERLRLLDDGRVQLTRSRRVAQARHRLRTRAICARQAQPTRHRRRIVHNRPKRRHPERTNVPATTASRRACRDGNLPVLRVEIAAAGELACRRRLEIVLKYLEGCYRRQT
jgi:hypothetical protein